MNNYTTIDTILKDENVKFVKKIAKGLSKPNTKFLTHMLYGITTQNSIILSDIARASSPNIQIKKAVEKYERHLDEYSKYQDLVETNYANMVKPYINNRKLYFVDGGDITKDKETKFENLGYVLDGSNKHQLSTGYKIYEIDTIDNLDQPISLVSDIESSNNSKLNDSNKELSENLEWAKRMKNVSKTYGNGTFVMDRGFDGANIMEEIINNGDDFIIRASHLNRKILVNNETTTISDLAQKCKGKYALTSKFRGNSYDLKASSFNFKIKSTTNKDLSKKLLTLVIVKGYAIDPKTKNEAYMALITSRQISGRDKTLSVVKDYILRWKIEENFKYKKQQFGLEQIKVRKFNRIKALGRLLSIILFFNNVVNLEAIGKHVRTIVKLSRKFISFWLYRIADGIAKSIGFFVDDIMALLYPPRRRRRRDLFTVSGIRYNPWKNA